MSTYEQNQEDNDPGYLYLVCGSFSYNNICFKIPNLKILKDSPYTFSYWYFKFMK